MQLSLLAVLIGSFLFSGLVFYFLLAKFETARLTIAIVLAPAISVFGYLLSVFDEFGLLTMVAIFYGAAALIGSTSGFGIIAITKKNK